MSGPPVQQLEVELELADGATVDQAALIPIFHRWIQEDRLGADTLLIDVADYRHVPGGPGVMLIADGAQWRMDEGGGRTGLVYARKRDPLGEPAAKLEEAFRNLLRAAVALEAEPALRGTLRFAGDRARVTVMSRLALAGDQASYAAFAPAVRAFAARLWDGEAEVGPAFEPREPLAVAIRADPATPAELLARLT